MSGYALKKAGIAQVSEHNPLMLEQILLFISQCRNGHLRTINHERTFTIEDLIHDFEKTFYKRVPSQLAGAIGREVRSRGYAEEIGPYVKAKDPERHHNKIPLMRWSLY